jgi:hypothetical protein
MSNELSILQQDLSLAATLIKSGLLPASVKTPEAAVVIIMTGRELGLLPLQALRSISVVEGKPTLSADLLLALAYKSGHCTGYEILELTDEKCVVQIARNGIVKPPYSYTIEEARKAGLANRPNWQRHTKAMLRARATAAACRAYFPDVVLGLYTPDELDDLSPVPAEAAPARAEIVKPAVVVDIKPALPAEQTKPALPAGLSKEDEEEATIQIEAVKNAILAAATVADLDRLGAQIMALHPIVKDAVRSLFVSTRKEKSEIEKNLFRPRSESGLALSGEDRASQPVSTTPNAKTD